MEDRKLTVRDQLPTAFAVLLGLVLTVITHSPVGLVLFAVIAWVQWHQRGQDLHRLAAHGYSIFAALFCIVLMKALLAALWPLAILAALGAAFCTSVLYARLKV